jgi:hypothetical protein
MCTLHPFTAQYMRAPCHERCITKMMSKQLTSLNILGLYLHLGSAEGYYTFGMDRVHYLGYISDQHGVHVDPAKIQVIRDWPASTTLTELQIFLGLSNIYRRFMLGFSHIAWALSQINRGGGKAKFVWGRSQQKAFDDLKQRLCSTPVISLPDLQHPFEIETDASDYVVGIVLTHHGHPVAYHSETLSYLRKYPTYDKEMYSIVKVCRQVETLHSWEGDIHPH